MRGVNAAVVGLLGAALYNPVWAECGENAGRFRHRAAGIRSTYGLARAAAIGRHCQRAGRYRASVRRVVMFACIRRSSDKKRTVPTAKGVLGAVICAAALAIMSINPATAGPPFQTDDPEPVPYQHFEFYTFSIGTAIRGDTAGEGPAWEYNYGIIPNGQFHIIAPADVRYAGRRRTGTAIQNSASNTASSTRTRTARVPWSASFRSSNCRPAMKTARSAPATRAPISRCGFKKLR